jgi:hypothetical protein
MKLKYRSYLRFYVSTVTILHILLNSIDVQCNTVTNTHKYITYVYFIENDKVLKHSMQIRIQYQSYKKYTRTRVCNNMMYA